DIDRFLEDALKGIYFEGTALGARHGAHCEIRSAIRYTGWRFSMFKLRAQAFTSIELYYSNARCSMHRSVVKESKLLLCRPLGIKCAQFGISHATTCSLQVAVYGASRSTCNRRRMMPRAPGCRRCVWLATHFAIGLAAHAIRVQWT